MNFKNKTEVTTLVSSGNDAERSFFAVTRWTLVVRAKGDSPEARAALAELCDAYYHPVLAFLCKERGHEEEARELTQEFFARMLGGSGFAGADQNRGRFRTYLLGALKNFLMEARQRAQRQKRGGGVVHQSLNETVGGEEGGSGNIEVADDSAAFPDASFDREWALEVMRRALAALETELSDKGKREQFEILKPSLGGECAPMPLADAARRLGMNESALKVAMHRLRKRFGELVRAEITQTLRNPAQAEEELGHLIAALSR